MKGPIMDKAVEVRFKCEACGKSHGWRPQLSNKKAKCSCGHVMRVPVGPTGLAVKSSKSGRTGKERLLEVDEEDVTSPPSETRAKANATSNNDPWRWRALCLSGGLIGLISAVGIFVYSHYLAWPLGGLMVGALLFCLGLWARPLTADST
jgi:hypothetical protein